MLFSATRTRFVPALLLCAVVAACSLAAAGGEGKTVTLSDKDDRASVCLAPGDVLVVKLEAQLGTGYGWRVARSDRALLRQLGDPEIETPEKGRPGAKERQVFRFTALAAGKSPLELHYARPWEKDAPPARTYSVEVEVK